MNWQTSGKILVQGIREGEVLTQVTRMKKGGAPIVGGINPGRESELLEDIPIFALVEEAIASLGEIQTSLIFTHPYRVLDAVTEAIAGGIKQLILFTGEVPPLDVVRLLKIAQQTNTFILGPGSGGILIPEQLCLGIWEPQFYQSGTVAILSDSSHLSYEVALALNRYNLGESMIVSLGTDPIIGSDFADWLEFLNSHPETKAIALVTQLERIDSTMINHINNHLTKPIVIYAYNLVKNRQNYLKNFLNIMTNQLSYGLSNQVAEVTIKDLLKESNIILATRPSQIGKLLSGPS